MKLERYSRSDLKMVQNNFEKSFAPFLVFARIFGIFPKGSNRKHFILRFLSFSCIYAVLFTICMSILSIDCGLIIIEKMLLYRTHVISRTSLLSFGIGLILQMTVKCCVCIFGTLNGTAVSRAIVEISKYDRRFQSNFKVKLK